MPPAAPDLQGPAPPAQCDYDAAASPLDIGGGRLALIMPLLARTLQQLALRLHSHAPLPPGLLLRVLADVLGALALLHGRWAWRHCDVQG